MITVRQVTLTRRLLSQLRFMQGLREDERQYILGWVQANAVSRDLHAGPLLLMHNHTSQATWLVRPEHYKFDKENPTVLRVGWDEMLAVQQLIVL